MTVALLLEQALNGLELGVMLFLVAAGLTLTFGIMNFINLAHGSLYMMGAYFGASVFAWTGSFLLALAAAIPLAMALGVVVERVALRRLYERDHLDQVLATFGLILFFNELARLVWGPAALFMDPPGFLSGTVELIPGSPYPAYRLAIVGAGLASAVFLYGLVGHTRLGMLIRAGASNATMVGALGVNIRLLFTLVFGLGAALAGLAGVMAGPIVSVQSGMGEEILILAFVVVVIGGIGSIRGAFLAALLIGVLDTMGRAFLPDLFLVALAPDRAHTAASTASSMLVYLVMAGVLCTRPRGLFPPSGR